MRATIEAYLKPKDQEELDAFGLWAFGEGFEDIDHSLKFMHAWNKIHGEKLLLEQDGVIQHDIPKMIELWKITKLVNRCRKDEDGDWHTMIGCNEKN